MIYGYTFIKSHFLYKRIDISRLQLKNVEHLGVLPLFKYWYGLTNLKDQIESDQGTSRELTNFSNPTLPYTFYCPDKKCYLTGYKLADSPHFYSLYEDDEVRKVEFQLKQAGFFSHSQCADLVGLPLPLKRR